MFYDSFGIKIDPTVFKFVSDVSSEKERTDTSGSTGSIKFLTYLLIWGETNIAGLRLSNIIFSI